MGVTTQQSSPYGRGRISNEYYKFDKFLWLEYTEMFGIQLRTSMFGPFCSKEGCRARLDSTANSDHTSPTTYKCPLCSKEYSYPKSRLELRRLAEISHEAKVREEWPVIALDQPPANLSTRDEDDRYWLAARIGTKNAKAVGVVYFGDKTRNKGSKSYAQVFVDLDDEQVRHDPANMNPTELIARMEVEFLDTTTSKKVK